jgi:hypothetical protein
VHTTATKAPNAWASTRIPPWKRKLLESVQEKRNDRHLSDTVEAAIDALIEQHFPGSTRES